MHVAAPPLRRRLLTALVVLAVAAVGVVVPTSTARAAGAGDLVATVHADGVPVEGAYVVVNDDEFWPGDWTDASGEVTLTDVAAGTWTVEVFDPVYNIVIHTAQVTIADGEITTVTFDVELAGVGDLTVTVDAAGPPIEGLVVAVSGPGYDNAVTDAAGVAEFVGLVGGVYDVTVWSPDLGVELGTTETIVAADQPNALTVAISVGALEIELVDQDDSPLVGYDIWLDVGAAATTDGAGIATFPFLPPGTYEADLYSPDFVRVGGTTVTVTAGETTSQLVTLSLGTLAVHVEDAVGSAVEGAEIEIGEPVYAYGVTDASGTAVFTGIPAGTYGVTVSDPVTYEVGASAQAEVVAGASNSLTIVLDPGSLAVTVIDADGLPIAGAWVAATDSLGTTLGDVTDGSGWVDFGTLPPGDYVVEVTDDWGELLAYRLVAVSPGSVGPTDETIQVTFGRLEVTVTGTDGEPWSSGYVDVVGVIGYSDLDDGVFVIDHVPTGTFPLEVWSWNGVEPSIVDEVTIDAGATTSVAVQLPIGTVDVGVTTTDLPPAPFNGAEVWVGGASGTTDPLGEALALRAAAGDSFLTVDSGWPWYESLHSEVVTVVEGDQRFDVVGELPAAGSAGITVVDTVGAPVVGVDVVLGDRRVTTDGLGVALVEDVPSGWRWFEVVLPTISDEYYLGDGSVEIVAGETATATIEVDPPQFGSLSVAVADDGIGVASAVVYVDGWDVGTTDGDGQLLVDVVAGEHDV
ncbi:MAG: hypothetical protein KDB37_17260, partial [Ilumatobacter sp.]|nr:hypothetical protein [Ilumatobacter sp.]